MNPTVYVTFKDGECREAMAFYAELFGGEVVAMMTFADGPMEMPPEKADWVMHSTVAIPGGAVMGCDDMGQYEPMAGCSISLDAPDLAKGRAIFAALAAGGKVTMPFEETFFSPGFGTVRDRFGINWMVGVYEEMPAG
ncbi:VOC family protein [Aliiruegeria sabulilitoris]|uniref:VOC family protein n=1 Tax=Aliiruegeria sabulilitoris TaxID=1510458 RepID=UPI000830BF34|nr:VOC family protein [Aliiruegeria sabulilitoris]NDR59006.1 VOC family protein [Pseudoruegeria sp. M32A2M]